MNNKTRKITEGAVFTAIVGIFLIINRQTAGLLEGYLFWLMPMPILVYAARYGWKDAIMPFVAMMLISLVVALPTTMFMVGITGVTGLAYGAGVRKGKSNFWLFGTTLFFTSINYLVTMVLFAAAFGYDLKAEAQVIIDTLSEYGYQLADSQQLVQVLIPVSLLLSAFLESLLVHLVANFLLKRLRIKVNPLHSLNEVKMPKWLGWSMLACMILNAAGGYIDYPTLMSTTFFTINVIAEIIFCIFGLIDIMVYSKATKRNYMTIIGIVLLFLLPSALLILGILDAVTDYRKRMVERNWHVLK